MARTPLRYASLALSLALHAFGCAGATTATGASPAPEATPFAPGPIWKTTSKRIEVTSFGFFVGSSGYKKDRADLTHEQLTALETARTIAPPTSAVTDATSYRLSVFDEDGTVAHFRAAETNARDSDEGAITSPSVDIATIAPFLGTLHCLAAKSAHGVSRTMDTPVDPSTVDPSMIVPLPADTGCVNGIFVPSSCSSYLFTFDVAVTATYDVVGGPCIGQLGLRVFTSDRTTLLAQSGAGAGGSCFGLRYMFPAGRYVLALDKTTPGGCATDGVMAGDTSLAVVPVK